MDHLIETILARCTTSSPPQQKVKFSIAIIEFMSKIRSLDLYKIDYLRALICNFVTELFCVFKLYPYSRKYRPTIVPSEYEKSQETIINLIQNLSTSILFSLNCIYAGPNVYSQFKNMHHSCDVLLSVLVKLGKFNSFLEMIIISFEISQSWLKLTYGLQNIVTWNPDFEYHLKYKSVFPLTYLLKRDSCIYDLLDIYDETPSLVKRYSLFEICKRLYNGVLNRIKNNASEAVIKHNIETILGEPIESVLIFPQYFIFVLKKLETPVYISVWQEKHKKLPIHFPPN